MVGIQILTIFFSEEHLLRGTATLSEDGTLLIGSPDGNDLHTHLTIPGKIVFHAIVFFYYTHF